MDNNKSKCCLLMFLILFSFNIVSSSTEEQNSRSTDEVDSVRSSNPYWVSIKTFTTKAQAYFFRPNLDFKSRSGEDGSMRVEEAAGKSFKKGKEMVEESAEAAARVTGQALHKTKDTLFGSSDKDKHQPEL